MSPTDRQFKLGVPRLANAITRPRLMAKLQSALTTKLTWVGAPAGSGKTTLAASVFESTSWSVLWVTADGPVEDLSTLLYCLRTLALGYSSSRELPPLEQLPRQGQEAFVQRFFRALFARFSGPTVLVLDNQEEFSAEESDALFKVIVDELPDHVRMLVLSRNAIPPSLSRLRVDGTVSTLTWTDLRLTSGEAEHIAASVHGVEQRQARMLYERSDGWFAGFVVLLEHLAHRAEPPRQTLVPHAENAVAGLFSNLFERATPAVQNFLLTTSFLHEFTLEQAAALSDRQTAQDTLAWLYERNLFIGRSGDGTTYHYHTLFRDYLSARATRELPPPELRAAKLAAAGIAAAKHHFETALRLMLDLAAWQELSSLLETNGGTMLRDGGAAVLERLLSAAPEAERRRHPTLDYWLGLAQLNTTPAAARVHLQRAYAAFSEAHQHRPRILACGAVLHSYFLEWGDYRATDQWMSVLQQARHETETLLPPEDEAQLICCLVGGIHRHLGHPLLEDCAHRALQLLYEVRDATQRAQLGAFALCYFAHQGHWGQGIDLIRDIDTLVNHGAVAPLPRLEWNLLKLLWLMAGYGADIGDSARAELDGFLSLAGTLGVNVLDEVAMAFGVLVALHRLDYPAAGALVSQLQPAVTGRHNLRSQLCWLRATLALVKDNFAEAHRQLDTALEGNQAVGATCSIAQCHLLRAQVYALEGRDGAAVAEIVQLLDIARHTRSAALQHAALLLHAYVLLERGDRVSGLERLREALHLSKQTGQRVIAPWGDPRITRFLYAQALRHDVECEHTRSLITRLDLRPLDQDIPAWPWPISIQLLGAFELSVQGRTQEIVLKGQRRPLDVLRALIALGGRQVPVVVLIDCLWSAEEITPRGALDTALLRLRKILGRDDAVLMNDGKVSLNDQLCWVDAWAFERAADRYLLTHSRGEAEKALALYRGELLGGISPPAWAAPLRERLAAKFQTIVTSLGDEHERAAEWSSAARTYQRALTANGVAEDFYRRLIRCYWRMGQQAEAIQVYRRCCDALHLLTRSGPSAATTALYSQVLESATP